MAACYFRGRFFLTASARPRDDLRRELTPVCRTLLCWRKNQTQMVMIPFNMKSTRGKSRDSAACPRQPSQHARRLVRSQLLAGSRLPRRPRQFMGIVRPDSRTTSPGQRPRYPPRLPPTEKAVRTAPGLRMSLIPLLTTNQQVRLAPREARFPTRITQIWITAIRAAK